nr:hypothetical protein CFP56_78317 [Quercus suber]
MIGLVSFAIGRSYVEISIPELSNRLTTSKCHTRALLSLCRATASRAAAKLRFNLKNTVVLPTSTFTYPLLFHSVAGKQQQ